MEKVRIARSASVVGLATLLSRILGLAREMIILKLFGKHLTDAFYAAFRFPNTLRYLMGEGAMSAAFIPVFTDYLRNRSRKEAWELATAVMLILAVVSSCVAVLAILFAPWVVSLLLWGFRSDPQKFALTVSLTRWMFPYLIFVTLVALCMGVLNSLGHFAMPSLAQAAFNLTVIFSALFLAPRWGASGTERIFAVALGVLIGGGVQLGMQVPVLWRKGFHLVVERIWSHPELMRIMRLIVPAIAGLAVYQIDLLVDNFFASFLPEGSVTYLFAAQRIIQFPIGTFPIAIATVAFPLMARYAVARDMTKLKEALNYALRLTFFVTIPASVGLIVLGRPIIQLLYERGEFLLDHSTDPTYWAVLFYSMGVFAIGSVSVVVRCFYSLEDTRTPVRVACVALVVNAVLDYILMKPLLHGGLALSTSISSCLNLFLLLFLLRQKIGRLGLRTVGISLYKAVSATLAMALISWVSWRWMMLVKPGNSLGDKALHVFIPLTAGVLVYIIAAFMLRSQELRELWHEFRYKQGHAAVSP